MHFVIHCIDTADPSIRQTHYPAHRAYLAAAPLKIVIAGPILDETGEVPIGSLLVIEAENWEVAQAFASSDPFAINGAWDSIQIHPFRISVENR
ncbi:MULTISPECIES: YciI family protein [unclassified Methylobacterium]|uniref:YciI family protein n=1 Tax=unclassified Methylobacterium TaxID=2615210 RepID=UPI0011C1D727|nr:MULTISPECIES: YciI family protein [unclassified Methylobacterium]MCJ2116294.1 YciI family protein [Methylobacterium sp. J-001]QEE41660.1 YciI family protein [Methylobacterium sp. WL1]TXN54969.1 YciI family protein [Methylobacterium sp. WL2]